MLRAYNEPRLYWIMTLMVIFQTPEIIQAPVVRVFEKKVP